MFVKKLFKNGISLKTTILSLFAIIMVLLTAVLSYQLFYFSKKLSLENANTKLEALVHNIKTSITQNEVRNLDTIEMLSLLGENYHLELYTKLLESHPYLYALYIGKADKSFYEIINLNISPSLKEKYQAKANDKWLLIQINKEDLNKRSIIIYDENLNLSFSKVEDTDYDPTKRPWYINAIKNPNSIKTAPYEFFNINSTGITYSKEIDKTGTVVSLGILLDDFLSIYESYVNKDSMELFLFREDGLIISSTTQDEEIFKNFFEKNKNLKDFQTAKVLNILDKKYIIQLAQIKNLTNKEYLVLFSDYEKTIATYKSQVFSLLLIFLITSFLMIPLIIYFSKFIIKPIYQLVRQSRHLRIREYEAVQKVETPIYELSLLSSAFENMSKSIYDYQVSLEEKVKQRTKELSIKNKELEKLSITDKLTGIFNRVRLDKVLQEELEKSLRYKNDFSIILMDIDFFKMVNDTYGHQVGDDVLQESAQIFQKNIRKVDVLGRWGGEEFLIICPKTYENGAKQLALHINEAFRKHKFKSYPKQITISLGVASFNNDISKAEELVSRVDNALYRAKNSGRNKVVVFSDD